MNDAEHDAGLAATPGYRYADVFGDELFVAGQVPHDCDQNVVGVGDVAAQAARCLDNLFTLVQVHGFERVHTRRLVVYVVGEDTSRSPRLGYGQATSRRCRSMGMRAVVWVVGVGVVLAACGGSSPDFLESVPTPTPTTSADATMSSSSSAPSTTIADDDTATAQTTEPDSGDGTANQRAVPAIESALLPDDAFPPPWEPKGRRADRVAYGAGPNQTNCAAYWRIEELRGGDGGHAMWWIDGANANHYVSRLDRAAGNLLLADLVGLANACPVVNWGEGGSFTIDGVLVDDGVGFRLTDSGSNETTWIGVTTHRDLVSVLDVPTWLPLTPGTRPVDFDGDDLNRLVSQMSALLVNNPGPQVAPSSSAPPMNTVPPTRVPQITPATTVPRQTKGTTTTTPTTVPPADNVVHLLLTTDELPDGFGDIDVDPHRQDGTSEDDLLELCPAAVSIERIDLVLEWDSDARTSDGLEFGQLIGRAPSRSEANEIVTQFAQVAACDLSVLFGSEAVTSGGAISVAGADGAASLLIESPEGGYTAEMLVFSVGDVVAIITMSGAGPVFESSLDDELAVRAVKKIAAASR